MFRSRLSLLNVHVLSHLEEVHGLQVCTFPAIIQKCPYSADVAWRITRASPGSSLLGNYSVPFVVFRNLDYSTLHSDISWDRQLAAYHGRIF